MNQKNQTNKSKTLEIYTESEIDGSSGDNENSKESNIDSEVEVSSEEEHESDGSSEVSEIVRGRDLLYYDQVPALSDSRFDPIIDLLLFPSTIYYSYLRKLGKWRNPPDLVDRGGIDGSPAVDSGEDRMTEWLTKNKSHLQLDDMEWVRIGMKAWKHFNITRDEKLTWGVRIKNLAWARRYWLHLQNGTTALDEATPHASLDTFYLLLYSYLDTPKSNNKQCLFLDLMGQNTDFSFKNHLCYETGCENKRLRSVKASRMHYVLDKNFDNPAYSPFNLCRDTACINATHTVFETRYVVKQREACRGNHCNHIPPCWPIIN